MWPLRYPFFDLSEIWSMCHISVCFSVWLNLSLFYATSCIVPKQGCVINRWLEYHQLIKGRIKYLFIILSASFYLKLSKKRLYLSFALESEHLQLRKRRRETFIRCFFFNHLTRHAVNQESNRQINCSCRLIYKCTGCATTNAISHSHSGCVCWWTFAQRVTHWEEFIVWIWMRAWLGASLRNHVCLWRGKKTEEEKTFSRCLTGWATT